jgi:hypothetical protein
MLWSGYVYVYSPLTALMTAQSCYCNCNPCSGCPHSSGFSNLGFCCPTDIGGSGTPAGADIKFYGSTYIKSIVTEQRTNFCQANPPAPYEDAVVVYLYRYENAVCLIGKVFYGHLYNRVANGTYNRPQYQGLRLGESPACCAACYGGVHVHMARNTGGQTIAYNCYASLSQGSSKIYQWYWNDAWCS